MPDINVQKVVRMEEQTLPMLVEAEHVVERIRQRAFELFAGRGFGDGRALDDWLAAERELCGPPPDLVESAKDYVLSIALPRFEPGEIEVAATPRALIVNAKGSGEAGKGAEGNFAGSDVRSNCVYWRMELPADLCVDDVKASLKNGVLKVVAPKAKGAAKPGPST